MIRLRRQSFLVLAGLLALCALLLPMSASAQATQLRVTLHDLNARPVAGISIILRDEAGAELAQQSTNEAGETVFEAVPDVVRVAVAGQPHGRPRLYQLGDDARGVRMDLAQAGAVGVLNLRIEQDGLVLPDPATMITREQGGPIVTDEPPIATARIATPAPLATAELLDTDTQVVAVAGVEEERPGERWAPVATLLIIVVAVVVMLVIQRRRSAL